MHIIKTKHWIHEFLFVRGETDPNRNRSPSPPLSEVSKSGLVQKRISEMSSRQKTQNQTSNSTSSTAWSSSVKAGKKFGVELKKTGKSFSAESESQVKTENGNGGNKSEQVVKKIESKRQLSSEVRTSKVSEYLVNRCPKG